MNILRNTNKHGPLTIRALATFLVLAFAVSIMGGVAWASDSPATAPDLGSAGNFAVLAGTAVTCTESTVDGDVGVHPGSAVTQTLCSILGDVHAADVVAGQAYSDFIDEFDNLAPLNNNCDPAHTLIGTLAGITILPGVYCVDTVAKTGELTLDAQGDTNAVWLFLVNGALTGTNFDVVTANGGAACNVYWRAEADATMTTSNFAGSILSGGSISITGGAFVGDIFATDDVTMTNTGISECVRPVQPVHGLCMSDVTWNPLPTTFVTDTTPVPNAPDGTFTFDARMTNIGASTLTEMESTVLVLTKNNLILNFPESPAGVGDTITLPNVGGYSDGLLSPGEEADFQFVVGLNPKARFRFFVDLKCTK